MKTLLISNLKPEFTFAGFNFPKYVWTLPKGDFKKRISQRSPVICGAYFHTPRPIKKRNSDIGMGFYLDSDGMPSLRWQWADDVCNSIQHTGWFLDTYDQRSDDTVRGVVFRLPHGRGFLAGWSMGEGMASEIDYTIYEDETDAALAADSWAEQVAENERDYREEQNDEDEEEAE